MSKFKVGDRIALYSNMPGSVCRTVHTIEMIDNEGMIYVRVGMFQALNKFHQKQCRKLVKKPRRRIYLCPADVQRMCKGDNPVWLASVYLSDLSNERIEFVEVKKK